MCAVNVMMQCSGLPYGITKRHTIPHWKVQSYYQFIMLCPLSLPCTVVPIDG